MAEKRKVQKRLDALDATMRVDDLPKSRSITLHAPIGYVWNVSGTEDVVIRYMRTGMGGDAAWGWERCLEAMAEGTRSKE